MKKLSKLFAIFFLTFAFTALYAQDISQEDEEAKAIEAVTGLGDGSTANPNGCLILSDTAALAEVMLENVNGVKDDMIANGRGKIIMATGKLAEDLKGLFKQVKTSFFNVKENVLVIYGDAAQKIAEEFEKTDLVSKKLWDNQKKNIILLGSQTLSHAFNIMGNLAATGLFNTLRIAVKGADLGLFIGACAVKISSLLLVATAAGTLLVLDLGVLALTSAVKWTEEKTIYLTNVSAKAIVGYIQKDQAELRFQLEATDKALNDAFNVITAKEKEIGDKAVADTEKMKTDALAKLKEALKNFGKKASKVHNHKNKICKVVPIV